MEIKEEPLRKVTYYVVPNHEHAPDQRYEVFTTMAVPELHEYLEKVQHGNTRGVKIAKYEMVGTLFSKIDSNASSDEGAAQTH